MAYHAKRLEAEEESKRKQEGEEAPEEKRAKEPRKARAEPEDSGPFVENESHTPDSSSSRAPTLKVKSKFDGGKKKEVRFKGEGTCGYVPTGPAQSTPEVTQV